MISARAEGFIGLWQGNADSDTDIQEIATNAPKFVHEIRRFVAPSKRVDDLLAKAVLMSKQISIAYQNDDLASVSRLRKTLRDTLDLLTTACDEAGLSDEARVLGS